MYFLNNKKECCGCSACLNICPKGCIRMKLDEEGFNYPYIYDEKSCIECKLCEKTCPILNKEEKSIVPEVYACKNINEEIRRESSSGGIFTLIAEFILNNNGIVFGGMFDEEFDVIHGSVDSKEKLYKLRGSKYSQSDMNDCYKRIRGELNKNRLVLFSGTPCQVGGLHKFLKRKYDNLYTIDVACHGVPSPTVFKKYKSFLEKKHNSKIENFTFRSKEEGWTNYKLRAEFKNGQVFSEYGYENTYMKGFIKDLYIRPSCTDCKFKNFTSGSDIMLADYWGYDTKFKEFDNNTGVSLVFTNSNKGKELFKSIQKDIKVEKTEVKHATQYNPCIIKSVSKHKKSKRFYKNIDSMDFNSLVLECIKERKETKIEYYFRAIINVIKIKLGYNME